MFGALDISTSGLVAQRTRIDTVAGNIANAHTIGYQRRVPIFQTGLSAEQRNQPGVHVSEIKVDTRPGQMKWDPNHPFAIQSGDNKGYVELPNVNEMHEMINAIAASRAYDANITMMNATRTMLNSAIQLFG